MSDNFAVWNGELEHVDSCPACGEKQAKVEYESLSDIVFAAASGRWTIWSCQNCGSGFLNPRPTTKSIHKAYEIYYTHGQSSATDQAKKLQSNNLLQRTVNGRLYLRYGLQREPMSLFAGTFLNCVPYIGHFFDPWGRMLHRPTKGGAKLLDFGCGDGRFLLFAQEMGYTVRGLDFDPKAVSAAQEKGLDVQLGDYSALPSADTFDAITISHVIEHVHFPRELLRQSFNHLNEGGRLYIETPNFDAYGRQKFGSFWRGLEVPRHLTIFSERALESALRAAGFAEVNCTSRHMINLSMYADSRKLACGQKISQKSVRDYLSGGAIWDGLRGIFSRSRTEFLRFEAVRSKA